jgi:hypothetical protein
MSGMPIHGVTVCLDYATFDERLRVFSERFGQAGGIDLHVALGCAGGPGRAWPSS